MYLHLLLQITIVAIYFMQSTYKIQSLFWDKFFEVEITWDLHIQIQMYTDYLLNSMLRQHEIYTYIVTISSTQNQFFLVFWENTRSTHTTILWLYPRTRNKLEGSHLIWNSSILPKFSKLVICKVIFQKSLRDLHYN